MNDPSRYTHVAAQAVSLVEVFDARFAAGLDGPVPFRVQLAAPSGPSTGGGKQVVQVITLVPMRGGPTIVIGAANTIRQTVELRSFALLTDLYAQRFKGAQIPVLAGAYARLLAELTTFFGALRLAVKTADVAQPRRALERSRARFGRAAMFTIAATFLAIAVALWLRILLKHG